jgi:hypothetical protein
MIIINFIIFLALGIAQIKASEPYSDFEKNTNILRKKELSPSYLENSSCDLEDLPELKDSSPYDLVGLRDDIESLNFELQNSTTLQELKILKKYTNSIWQSFYYTHILPYSELYGKDYGIEVDREYKEKVNFLSAELKAIQKDIITKIKQCTKLNKKKTKLLVKKKKGKY